MKQIIFKTLTAIGLLRHLPLAIFVTYTRNQFLRDELIYWKTIVMDTSCQGSGVWANAHYIARFPEYCSVLYHRMGGKAILFRWLSKGQAATYIDTEDIGRRLVLQHGHSIQINAKRIGECCQIWHNVTIGKKFSGTSTQPTIGNDVKICAGAIVLGDIQIGDHATIGAGAVVVKDVPAYAVAVGNPARILLKDAPASQTTEETK